MSSHDDIFLNEETEHNSCLVLCIDEYDNNDIDTRIFISYNEEIESYVINGKRNDLSKDPYFQPFMFCAQKSNDVIDFISLTLNTKSNFSYTLFNYNNLSYDIKDITYEFMEDNIDRRYEIAAYDNVLYSKKKFRQLVRLTKNLYMEN
jgi:hypothetical protein